MEKKRVNYTAAELRKKLKDVREKARTQGHIQGVAYAVAEMYRHGDEQSIWRAWRMPTLEECESKYKVAEFDMETLYKHQDELEKE